MRSNPAGFHEPMEFRRNSNSRRALPAKSAAKYIWPIPSERSNEQLRNLFRAKDYPHTEIRERLNAQEPASAELETRLSVEQPPTNRRTSFAVGRDPSTR